MKNKEFIYEYWSRTEHGKKMIESEWVSESDLLFLIPNNVKRMHGLPLTRIKGKRKRKRKNLRKNHILMFDLLDIISELIDDVLISKFGNGEFFGEFVEVKNLHHGQPVRYDLDKYKNVDI